MTATEEIEMKAEAALAYGPCPTHKLYHDLKNRECYYCLVEAAK